MSIDTTTPPDRAELESLEATLPASLVGHVLDGGPGCIGIRLFHTDATPKYTLWFHTSTHQFSGERCYDVVLSDGVNVQQLGRLTAAQLEAVVEFCHVSTREY